MRATEKQRKLRSYFYDSDPLSLLEFCSVFDVKPKDLLGRSQKGELTFPRQMLIVYMRAQLHSNSFISKFVGRNMATITYSEDRIIGFLESKDKKTLEVISEINSLISEKSFCESKEIDIKETVSLITLENNRKFVTK